MYQNHASGKFKIHTSLEKTLREEATEMINNYYSTSDRKRNLELELEKYKDIYSMYEISEIDSKLNINEMPLI